MTERSEPGTQRGTSSVAGHWPAPALGARGGPRWKRVLLTLAFSVLAMGLGALLPVAVDVGKLLLSRETLTVSEWIRGALLILGLQSLVMVPVGLAVVGMLFVLCGSQDAGTCVHQATGRAWATYVRHNRQPRSTATVYAALFGLAVFFGSTYKLTTVCFASFKNQSLAALLLSCLMLLVVAAAVLATVLARRMLMPVIAALARVRGFGHVASIHGAVTLFVLSLGAAAAVLCFKYIAIVRIIDWRPLTYPVMGLLAGTGLLTLGLWLRGARIARGTKASSLRHALVLLGAVVLFSGWSYAFGRLGSEGRLRTVLLRRCFGAAKSIDLLSRALDFDGDGYLSFFGGHDCAPFNAAVHPGAPEIPDNGIDDNCFGGDLSLAQLRPPARRFQQPRPKSLTNVRPSFVLITLDGLRADHLGAQGYMRPTSPTIDAFARRAVVFERNITQAPSTRYSIPSLMTSKYSSQVPCKPTTAIPCPILDDALLMAEIFKKAGYRTGAALSYMVFDKSWNLNQGFDFYDNSHSAYYFGKGSPGWNKDQPYRLIEVAKRFLDDVKDTPFLLWVHIFEPHPPYARRTEHFDFGPDEAGLYDGELRFGDDKVNQLLGLIAKHPQAARTIIALSSDHGRGLGEHGVAMHGYDLYIENLHVPLMFQIPGVPPRRIKNPVASLDILPTFVNLAGINDSFEFEGQSLVNSLTEGVEPDPKRPIFSEVQVGFHDSHVINAITTADYRLIYDVTYNTYQLFDHRKDPKEQHDVAATSSAALEPLRGQLHHVMERATLPTIQEEINSSIVAEVPENVRKVGINFGDQIEFLGFEVSPPRARAGEIMEIFWYVRGLKKMSKDYKFIVQLRGKRGTFFDAKHVPVRGQYPTSTWRAGEIIRDQQHMRLAAVPQVYEVWVGFGTGHDILAPIPPRPMENTAVRVGEFEVF